MQLYNYISGCETDWLTMDGYALGQSLGCPVVQQVSQLCIGVESRLSRTSGLLILACYTSGQLSGCATRQVNLN